MELKGFTYFWQGPLSQWHKASMLDVLEIEYNCCEQFMMATKAAIMKDMDTRHLIMATSDPRKQKALGRAVKNYDDKLWDKHKLGVVYLGNYYKFTQNEDLRTLLLNTGSTLLVEASPFDNIWGIGLEEAVAKTTDPSQWPGKNYLGKVLTLVREDIRNNYNTDIVDLEDRFAELGWL